MNRICFFRLGATPLFIANSARTFGGAEVRAFTFARALARRGKYDVSFAVEADSLLPNSVEGIQVRAIPKSPRGLAKLARSFRRRFASTPLPYSQFDRISADVIACFGIHDPTPNVIRSATSRGVRTLLFLTSSEDVRALSLGGSSKQRGREMAREFALRNASQIVAQTEFQQTELSRNFGVDSQVIRNPMDCRIPADAVNQARKYVLWVGRSDTDSKRADLCIELAKACPNVPFRMVMNDAESELGRSLRSHCPSNVAIEDHVALDQSDRLYAEATVLINTSVSEGFPNAFLQAAKFSTPIIALNVDPDGMLSKHGCGEMAGTLPNMANLLRKYHSGDQREAKGHAARKYVLGYHELSDRIAELEQTIAGVLSSKQAA